MKYRAWDTKSNSWIKPEDIQVNGLGQVFIFQEENQEWYEDKIGQSKILKDTQLKDKNGREIYEGDIVRVKSYGRFFNVRVEYLSIGYIPFCSIDEKCAIGDIEPKECEIIGNILEHPHRV